MPSHNTTIRYIGQPEGYRSDIPIDIISNCELTPESDVGLYHESDVTGLGLSFRADTENTRSVRALNYDGASRNKAILTLPKQLVKMFGLSGAPVTFFPGRHGLVAQISHTARLSIEIPPDSAPESTISDYSSGHYGVRAPVEVVEATEEQEVDLLQAATEDLWVWLDTTENGSLAIVVDTDESRVPESGQSVSTNPSMLYRKDGELGFLFPIPVGDILLRGERTVRWLRDGTRLVAVLVD